MLTPWLVVSSYRPFEGPKFLQFQGQGVPLFLPITAATSKWSLFFQVTASCEILHCIISAFGCIVIFKMSRDNLNLFSLDIGTQYLYAINCLLASSVCNAGCKKVKWSRYRPDVAQRVGRGIALLFHDRGTRRGWVSGQQHAPAALYPRERPSTHFTGGWVGPRAGLDGRKIRRHRDSIPDRPARSQSLYRLNYRPTMQGVREHIYCAEF